MLVKKHVKRLSYCCLLLSSATAFAGTLLPTSYQAITVTVPHTNPGFNFSIAGLALKPGANNLNYVIYNKELPAQTPTWTEEELKPGYTAAFELGAGYNFGQGNDIALDWTHMSSNNSANTVVPDASYFLGPDYEIGPAGLSIHNARGNAQFRYDVVNLDAGQFADFGPNVEMRFFGGLSTGFLREQVTATYTGTVVGAFAGPFSMQQQVIADFTGIGPRFGMQGDYNVYNGFGVEAEGALSALIGSSYSKTMYTGSAQQLLTLYGQTINKQFIRDQNVSQVIPGVDGKLAVTYKHAFTKNAVLTVSAGYQAAVYINAISQYLPGTLVAGTSLQDGGIFVSTMNHTLSNYSVRGPFLKASLQLS